LEATQKADLNVTPWLHWFFQCIDKAIDGAESTLTVVMRKGRFWERQSEGSFNERQSHIINSLLNNFEGKLSTSK
jgi:Fic family protein